MPSFNPNMLLQMLEEVRGLNLCPNRVWQACSLTKDWHSKQSMLQEILGGMFQKNSLRHEDHSACSINFCEFSSRNFTAVQQYHEPMALEESDQTNENHKDKNVCFPLKNLFHEAKLVKAIESGRLTAWRLDGLVILEHPRPFMAISHVWSDGTGVGAWPSKQVNACLYRYFERIAKRFQCEGIWWDTLCVPKDKDARSKALSIMDRNYEYSRLTLVHDRFLRNVPFGGPDSACLAIILSSWFTRGWTALELAKSRKVKVIFKDSIRDLDRDILEKAQNENSAAKAIKDLRHSRFSNLEDLLAALRPRHNSWLKDRATIAGLLAGLQMKHTKEDTFQRDIYQSILKTIGVISHDHLFHSSVTMSGGFSWCATNIFHLPHATAHPRLKINDFGEVSGSWKLFSVRKFDPKTCLWGMSHELIEEKLQYALEREGHRHLLLVDPNGDGHDIRKTKKGILVRVLRGTFLAKPRFKCQFVGSLYFSSSLSNDRSVTREITIGDTMGWEDLKVYEDAWHIMERENELLPENRKKTGEGRLTSAPAEPRTDPEWTSLHHAAWLGDARLIDMTKVNLAGVQVDDQRAWLQQRDKLGRRAIHLAAERGHYEFVRMLLDENDDSNSPIQADVHRPIYSNPDNGQTPLHRAAWGDSLETVQLLLDRGSDVNAADRSGNTALHIAADMGFGRVVKRLCEQAQTHVGVQGQDGLTPLHYAALRGHDDIAKILIARNAPLDTRDKLGRTPLHCAAGNGQVSVAELLLDKGAKVNETDERVGWTPLHYAAGNGQVAVAELLLEKGAKVNETDAGLGWTALHCAAEDGQVSMTKLLLDKGAKVNKMDDKVGWAPLHFAAMKGNAAAVDRLIMGGADINKADKIGFTPFIFAAINGHYAVIDSLISRGATIVEGYEAAVQRLDWRAAFKFVVEISERWAKVYLAAMDRYSKATGLVDDDDTYGVFEDWHADYSVQLLRLSARCGFLGTVRLLQQNVTKSEDRDYASEIAWLATTGGHDDVARVLLEEIDTHAREALLFRAVKEGHKVAMGVLLRAGVNMEAKDDRGFTPLVCAIEGRDRIKAGVQLLLDAGADTEAEDEAGITPLMLAAAFVQNDSIRLLLEAGANIEATSKNGVTPLLAIAGAVFLDVMQVFLEADANTEATDNDEDTLLAVATSKWLSEAVRVLLEAGANIEATTDEGDTALLLAASKWLSGTVQTLIEAGANTEARNKSGETLLSIAEGKGWVVCDGKVDSSRIQTGYSDNLQDISVLDYKKEHFERYGTYY